MAPTTVAASAVLFYLQVDQTCQTQKQTFELTNQNDGTETIVDWWTRLGLPYTNDEEWADVWERLRREGWNDLFGPRIPDHCEDNTIECTADNPLCNYIVDEREELILTTREECEAANDNYEFVPGHPLGGSPKVLFEAGPFQQPHRRRRRPCARAGDRHRQPAATD